MAAFCFLSCGTSSSLSLRSRQHTILNASAVLRAMACAIPPEGRSGHLAESLPHTGYESNTCTDVSSEHTPINCSSRRNSFNLVNDVTTTDAASENSDGVHQQAAASGSSQFVPTCEVNPWLGADPWSANCCAVMCQTSPVLKETCSKEKIDADLESAQTLSERKKLHCLPRAES